MISTCFFWTTRRLSRWSLIPQQKKVDYLCRYLVLIASSSALSRVYWGPLICSRDGLIDDRNTDYPEVDNATYYQKVHGNLEDFAATPAFHAFGYMVKKLSGARCVDAVSSVDGLNLFSFIGADHSFFHLCWCRDGQAVSLKEIYPSDQLAGAVFADACGNVIPHPAAVNERLVCIDFPEERQAVVPAGSAVNDKPVGRDVFYPCLPDLRGIPWQDANWRGACSVSDEESLPVAGAVGDALRPEGLIRLPETEVLRDSRNRLWNVVDPHNPDRRLTIKRSRPKGIRRLTYLLKPSKGRRHWNNASLMLHRGINTPRPVAFYEHHERSGTRESYYICEFIPDAFSSRHVCAALERRDENFRGQTASWWFDLLAGFICRMHNRGIVHRDLSVGNLMFFQSDKGEIVPCLIDIGRAHITPRSAAPRHRILDLMRICYKLDQDNRDQLIDHYQRHWGETLPSWWKTAARYYDVKQGIKKRFKKMLGEK